MILLMDSTLIIVFLGRIFQIVLSLVSVRVYTVLLSTVEVGNLYLINSIVGLFALTFINPVGMYINRKLHKWADDKTVFNYFFLFNLYLAFLSIFSLILVSLLNKSFGVGSGINVRLLSLFIMLNLYFNTWYQTIIPALNMLNYRRSFVFFTLLTITLGLALSFVLVMSVGESAICWLSGQLIAQVVMTIVGFLYFKKVTRALFDFGFIRRITTWENFHYLVAFSLPLAITTFFMWIQSQSYRMVVEKYIGLEFLGMLGVGLGISASIALVIESLAQQIYYPVFYSGINTSDPASRASAWNKMAQLSIPIYVSVTILVSCLAPYLVKILVSEKFSHVYVFVIYGAWIELFRMTTNILSSVAHSEMKTKFLVKAYSVGGVVALLGVYCGSKAANYQQFIPIILVMSGLATMLIMYMTMKKLMPINIGFNRIGKSILYSLPFAIIPLVSIGSTSMLLSLLLVAISGLYFLSSQYFIYKTTLHEHL